VNNRLFIGIDPGIKGGVAFIFENSYSVSTTPGTVQEMANMIVDIKSIAPNIPIYCCIEAVHSMPGNSGRSMFTFGTNYGQWLGILATLKIPYIQVTPHKWMSHYGKMPKVKKDRKNHIKHLAQQRFPNVKINLTTSDAMLIANYLKETNVQ
tara:strand:+ start:2097 stop:2552 length:456 start_codon:yes stop_codon:yes gene_type:complete